MRFSDVFDSCICNELKADSEVSRTVKQFKDNIPGRVLSFDFDASRSNKQGIKDGNTVYKLGLDVSTSVAFLEYYENFNQGQPTMAMYVDKQKDTLTVTGSQASKRLFVKFSVVGGEVKKTVQMN